MDKNTLKEYFRSGARPTQQHFYALIDACFNEDQTIFLSGYDIKTDSGDKTSIKSITREAGKTKIIPWFQRINMEHNRNYHYSVPCVNLAPHVILNKIYLDFQLPSSGTYTARDKSRNVEITQEVLLESITVYNGTEELMILDKSLFSKNAGEFTVDKTVKQWQGISIDIRVSYKLNSKIAVSDEFDITKDNSEELAHIFGAIGCEFKPGNL